MIKAIRAMQKLPGGSIVSTTGESVSEKQKSSISPTIYSDEVKQKAISLMTTHPLDEISLITGVKKSTLYGWRPEDHVNFQSRSVTVRRKSMVESMKKDWCSKEMFENVFSTNRTTVNVDFKAIKEEHIVVRRGGKLNFTYKIEEN